MSTLTSDTLTKIFAAHAPLFSIHQYPDYHATVDGRIFSMRTGRYLKPIKMGRYLGVQIKDEHDRLVKRYVHRLVLEIFAGPCPEGMEARHLNGDRHDNRRVNLQWGTKAENAADKIAHGTSGRGERNPMARLTAVAVEEIRRRAASGEVQRSLAREYGVSPMTVSRAVRGESWGGAR